MGQLVFRLLIWNNSIRFGSRIAGGCHSQMAVPRGCTFRAFTEEVTDSSAIKAFALSHTFLSDTILLGGQYSR